MAILKLKRRYGFFFSSKEETELVFALYEDINGNIHFKYCNYDTDTYIMKSESFFEEFEREMIKYYIKTKDTIKLVFQL